ncbi:MAG: ROK family protein [Acidimicrobiia bacterium]|nr:ROK family protein [Acidimicrobiia bacterium]
MSRYAAIEAGGTKFRVAISQEREVVADTTIATTTPDETLGATVDFVLSHGPVVAAGIACFGPLDLLPGSANYGAITATPKPHWAGTPVLDRVRSALGVPAAIDVDVGGAALGEWQWGAARGLSHFVYLTIGTGIGGGVFIDGKVHHGMGHPEMGHITLERVAGDDYAGHCPFHGACFEGMAAGPAIEDRWGASGTELAARDEVWDLEATYVAQALRSYSYVVAPQRVIIGGGVMQVPGLIERVRDKLGEQLAGYATSHIRQGSLDDYVVYPQLGQDAGLYGAIALAMRAHEEAG